MVWGIVANFGKKTVLPILKRMTHWAKKEGIKFVIYESEKGTILDKVEGIEYRHGTRIADDIEIMLAVGGDGTFLRAARLVGRTQKPIVGINIGKMGFLTEINARDLESALSRIKRGDYEIEKRIVLEAMFHNDSIYALNDIVIASGMSPRIMKLECYLNGEYLTTMEADGVIISTPTGSTAYSLSAGGPILTPEIDAVVISPVCPHTLGLRPIVVPANYRIKVVVRNNAGLMIADGQNSFGVEKGEFVIIEKADYHVSFIKFPDLSFYKVLREKLHWGGMNTKRGRR